MGYKRKLYPTLKKLYYYTTVTAATPIKVVFSQKSILHMQYNHFTETLALIKPVFVMFTATHVFCARLQECMSIFKAVLVIQFI